jgi:hypothetical protein
MTVTFELPNDLLARLEAEAARRGTTVEQLAVAALSEAYAVSPSGDAAADTLEAFVGSMDSGDPDWAATDTHVLRAQIDRDQRSA